MILEAAVFCLALNVYMESRAEPLQGQIAVAQVTYRRAKNNPENICTQVYKPKQFSWTETKSVEIKEPKAWDRAVMVAKDVISNKHQSYSNGATHFHANSVYPSWAGNMKLVAEIGNHRFYK